MYGDIADYLPATMPLAGGAARTIVAECRIRHVDVHRLLVHVHGMLRISQVPGRLAMTAARYPKKAAVWVT